MKKGLVLLLLLSLFSCDESSETQPIICTTEAKAGLNISVTLVESSSNIPISDGITVTATDGNYSETLQFFDSQNPIFSGAYERPGTYIVTVTKPGRQTYVSQPIRVSRDVCHVIPNNLSVVLL